MGGLVGGIRAQEIFGAVRTELVGRSARRLRRPHREAGLVRARRLTGRDVDRSECVDVGHSDRGGAGSELPLRERVDLRAVETVAAPGIRVRRDIEPVCVGADVRVVTKARTGVGTAGIRSVVGDVGPIDVPRPCWVRRLADREIEVIDVGEGPVRPGLKGQHDHEELLCRAVVVATRVSDKWAANAG